MFSLPLLRELPILRCHSSRLDIIFYDSSLVALSTTKSVEHEGERNLELREKESLVCYKSGLQAL
jgi:hypothetical protein